MNKIRAIQTLNKREIENGVSPEASWHTDYRDTAFVYFGGLPYNLSEGDIITIFSQYGEPVFLKLARDKETGKSKGFGWLKYEDQRSTDLAVDNLGGADVAGRMISVDHARYKARDDEDDEEFKVGWEDIQRREAKPNEEEESEEEEESRELLPEEHELATLLRDHDDDDPMKGFLIEEKKKEIAEARKKAESRAKRHKSRNHRSHRSRRGGSDDEGSRRQHRDRHRERHERRDGDGDSRRQRHRSNSRDGGNGRGSRSHTYDKHRSGGDRDDRHSRRRYKDDYDMSPRYRKSRSRSPGKVYESKHL